MRDPTLTPEEQVARFPRWISGYFTKHGAVVRAALEAADLDVFPSEDEFYRGIQRDIDQDGEGRSPTLLRIPQDKLAEMVAMEAFTRSVINILYFDREFYADCARKMIFDEELAKKYFPRASVRIVTNMSGNGDCLWSSYTIKRMLLERQASGRGGRKIDIVPFDGANHMVRGAVDFVHR